MHQIAHKSKGTTENKPDPHAGKLHDLEQKLIWWADIFNNSFFKDRTVPAPALSFKNTNFITLGQNVIGKYEFGLKDGYSRVILSRPLWEILVVIIHEMTHAWQALHGKPSNSWYHNQEFYQKLLECGIVCNKAGCNYGVKDPFVSLLKKHEIVINHPMDSEGLIKIPPVAKSKGKSKLKKWSCGCTNARVAVKDFQAKCMRCGNDFERAIP